LHPHIMTGIERIPVQSVGQGAAPDSHRHGVGAIRRRVGAKRYGIDDRELVVTTAAVPLMLSRIVHRLFPIRSRLYRTTHFHLVRAHRAQPRCPSIVSGNACQRSSLSKVNAVNHTAYLFTKSLWACLFHGGMRLKFAGACSRMRARFIAPATGRA
jgi:hypothetical protein